MDVALWRRSGRKTVLPNVTCSEADRIFNEHKKLLTHPYTTYYRITLQDPLAGGRTVRDSDMEVWGIGGSPKGDDQ